MKLLAHARLYPCQTLELLLFLSLSLSPVSMNGAIAADHEDPAVADISDFDVSAYKGKVVYLDFWASWCAPCKNSFPWMRKMQEQYRRDGLEVVAVDLDRNLKAAEIFLAENEVPFRILHDPKGKMAEEYKIEAMPTSFLYDRIGKQRFMHFGFRKSEEEAMESEITTLLAESYTDSTQR